MSDGNPDFTLLRVARLIGGGAGNRWSAAQF